MKSLGIWIVTLVLVAACGGGDNNPARPGNPSNPGNGSTGFTPPSGSRWSAQDYSATVTACTNAGVQYNRWDRARAGNYCNCDYAYASVRWTLEDFRANFDAYFDQMVRDGTDGNCLRQAGLQ